MTKRFFRLLHLWLGLLSGLIVVIVCLTGSLYAFKDELTAAREPWRDVTDTGAALLRPSALCAVADRAAGDSLPSSVTLGGRTEAAQVDYFSARGATTVFVNPYTGDVLKVVRRQPGDFDFFDFILQGHRRLWLPSHIGGPLVSYAVLAFFITLLTGLVVSWPRKWTRRAVKSHFAFHRPLRAARFRFDLHNVLGFYAVIPLIALCFTGLMFGLSWFSGGVYRLVSGGKPMASYRLPLAEDTGRSLPPSTHCTPASAPKRPAPCSSTMPCRAQARMSTVRASSMKRAVITSRTTASSTPTTFRNCKAQAPGPANTPKPLPPTR